MSTTEQRLTTMHDEWKAYHVALAYWENEKYQFPESTWHELEPQPPTSIVEPTTPTIPPPLKQPLSTRKNRRTKNSTHANDR